MSAIALRVGQSVPARPLIRLLLAFALAITRIASPSSQPSDLAGKLAAIEKQVEEKRRELGVPGVALTIVKDDQVILQKGFGLRDVDRKLPVTADTLFVIGSSTKSFTAMAAVISQDDGKLSLDDSPKKYLPSFRLQDPGADAMVTVRDLLLHRSGLKISDFVLFPGLLNRNELIKLVGFAKPTAKLRERFQYQNIGYTIAGEVVGRANGTTWERFVEERIFRPLGITSSHVSITQLAKAGDHATGYEVEDKQATKVTVDTTKAVIAGLSTLAPAGAINSNVKDMSQWIRLMLGRGTFAGKRIVSERGFNEIVRKQISLGADSPFGDAQYGLGWLVSERDGHQLVFHPGGVNGFNAMVAVVPDQRLGFVVLVNASSPLDEMITDVVFDIMVGKPETPAIVAGSVPQGQPPKNVATAGAAPAAAIDITLDDLIAKVIAAAGGEANLRRHRSTVSTATFDYENQGVIGKIAMYAQAPNSSAQVMTFTALGKTIGSWREYFDGTQAGGQFLGGRRVVSDQKYIDEELETTRISSDYYGLLHWKTLYKTVTIGKSTAAGEEVYVIVKTPEKGTAVTDYISAKSFLLVKRKSEGTGQETAYSDYRNVDGEMVPFTLVIQGDDGRVVGKIQQVKFNTSIPPSTFRP